jgi:hypothetical protein
MDLHQLGNSIRYHVFTGLALLGCLAPAITPRYFEINSINLRTNYSVVQARKLTLSEEIGSALLPQFDLAFFSTC